jgi:outer membrane protein assembly factor BamD (BamD/ComL family)
LRRQAIQKRSGKKSKKRSLREKDVEKRLTMIEEFRRLFPSSKELPMVNTLKLSIAAKEAGISTPSP